MAAAFISIKFIKFLVSTGAVVNAVYKSGWTALIITLVSTGIRIKKEIVDFVLAQNARINPPDATVTPLQCLIHTDFTYNIDQRVESLVAQGADVNAVGNDSVVVVKI